MADREGGWLGVPAQAKPAVRAGIFLGLGLGGFFDGIVFHQILQVHHMLSAHPDPTIAGDLRLNVMVDGFFHAVTYVFTAVGIGLLWRAARDPGVVVPGETLLGALVLGWGLFNVVEGVVDHHLLGIHHVWPAGPGRVLLWDLAFLAWGVLFVVGGYALVRKTDADPRRAAPDRTGRPDREEPE